ncbi:alpha/beta fold hydrolase [Geodermatophilus chilensis]|uniref:alpha/beta fold hydrolase n=1 Tax=Geodermatophilus chilensis TaxID=2035835 RepID=UPI000C26014D|nr:alpha/beta fold hydrolase [Geodermatophilus chilensis]
MSETFVLQHGAWHGGWAWQPVAARLRAAGHRVSAPTSPGLGVDDDPRGVRLADCVDALVAAVEQLDAGAVTLVGHSWGGYVVAGAAPRLAGRLARIVFLSAFVPAAGRSLRDEVPPDYQSLFDSLARGSGDDTVLLPLEVFQHGFMQDADPATAAVVHSLLRPQPYGTFTDPPVDGEAYRDLGVPLDYVLFEEDTALPPGEFGWAPRFPQRIGGTAVGVAGSHEALFTRPAETAEQLLRTVAGG